MPSSHMRQLGYTENKYIPTADIQTLPEYSSVTPIFAEQFIDITSYHAAEYIKTSCKAETHVFDGNGGMGSLLSKPSL